MIISKKGVIKLFGGNDKISSGFRMEVYGSIKMGAGNDVITGRRSATFFETELLGIKAGVISMGHGDDLIKMGGFLAFGNSILNTGKGNDRIDADYVSFNGTPVFMGAGKDTINARGDMEHGLGYLSLGLGSDRVQVEGRLNLYDGGNVVMGPGNDVLEVHGGLRMLASLLAMGPGDDTLDVRNGGVELDDVDSPVDIKLGDGNDRFIGFGKAIANPESSGIPSTAFNGVIDGGAGIDQMVLPQGVYTVTPNQLSSSLGYLPVKNFEILAGINGNSFPYASGVLTVDNNGMASFSPAFS
ncbi:hypothetical protein [Cyanobium sp. NIES-981]|uniref:hypothetical protein n=1 Tax=Cyanobium sp. NIES-981 TaxID=1851505 RepID=UPI0012F972DF|nr:hypothetical protein [Cyanobium sp. NIES-981]